MYIDAFFTECALREKWTIFFGMHEWTFLISVVAIGPVSAPDLLLVLQICFIFILAGLLQSDVVFVMTQVNQIAKVSCQPFQRGNGNFSIYVNEI